MQILSDALHSPSIDVLCIARDFGLQVSHHHLHGPVLKKSLPMLYLGGVDSSHSPECD